MLRHLLATAAILLLVCAGAYAQDEKPLGDVARDNNKNTQPKKAKIVLDDDTPGVKKKPEIIPAIFSDGIDNSDAIIAAILKYHKEHTDAETEQVVKDWYEDNDADLKHAIEETKRIDNAVEPSYTSEEEYRHAMRERARDLQERKENVLLMARIQNTFIRVRNRLNLENMRYEWFKIRCGNGNCSL